MRIFTCPKWLPQSTMLTLPKGHLGFGNGASQETRQLVYVRIVVPERLRGVIGKREYTVALGSDAVIAKRLAYGHVATIKAELHAAETRKEFPPESAEYIIQAARDARDAVVKGGVAEQDAEVSLDQTVETHLGLLREKHGEDDEGDPNISDTHSTAIRLAHRLFRGETVELLSHQVDMYLTEVAPEVRAQTLEDKRRVYGAFSKWLVTDREVSAITRKTAGTYVSTVMAKQGKAPKTVKSELAQLSALWKYMLGRGVVEANI